MRRKKISQKLQCINCKQLLAAKSGAPLQNDFDQDVIAYFEDFIGGNFSYPFSIVLHAFRTAHTIFAIF